MRPAAAADLLAEHRDIAARLRWLDRVGLGYVAIGQSIDTLSGGERQRLLLARHLAEAHDPARLRIVLDEPTAGLHGADVGRLLGLFDELVDAGAPLIAIEHRLRVIAHADHVVDLGPGAGRDGGTVVFAGPPPRLVDDETSVTGRHLARALARAA